MKPKKSYYYDEKNDLLEYLKDGGKGTVGVWAHNPYLVLMFSHDCTEFIPKNIVGFQLQGLKHLIKRAKEQADVPLTPKQEEEMYRGLTDIGWKFAKEDEEKT